MWSARASKHIRELRGRPGWRSLEAPCSPPCSATAAREDRFQSCPTGLRSVCQHERSMARVERKAGRRTLETWMKGPVLATIPYGGFAMVSGKSSQGPSPAGQPLPGTKQSVPDLDEQVAYHRAFEAVVWAMPASAIHRFRQGLYEVPGVEDNVVLAFSGTLESRHEAITPNTALPYIAAFTDLRGGPVVVEVPAATEKASLYGQVVDAWQITIAAVGPSGPDKGKGGKYLFLPPGHEGAIPEGFFPVRSTSYRLALAFRSIPGRGASQADAYAYTKTLKVYPLAEAGSPKPTRFVDGLPFTIHTLPHYDIRTLQDIHDLVSVEPVRERDKVMIGMLAAIGIEKGKPFDPSPRMKAAMERGVVDAYHYMQELTAKLLAENLWWPDRHWAMVLV